jgi:uncharacterized delta-60 repeat protein
MEQPKNGCNCALVQHASAASLYWAKTYGGIGDDNASCIQQTSDGGYVVSGYTDSFGAGEGDFWVLKLDLNGAIEWQKTYGGTGNDQAWCIQQTNDGGYVVAGETDSFGAGLLDIWILKLTSTGSVTWQKTYGGANNDHLRSIQQTSDGGYIVGGDTYSFGAGDVDAWILKLASNGSVIWQKTYGGSGYDWASAVQETSDGGYMVAGDSASFSETGVHVWVFKLNSNGSTAWQKIFERSSGDYAYCIRGTSDGGYIVAGETNGTGLIPWERGANIWVLKLNSSGSIDWRHAFAGYNDEWAYSVQQTPDGDYILAGYARTWTGGYLGAPPLCEYTPSVRSSSQFRGSAAMVRKPNSIAMGYGNYLVLKLNSSGSILWQRAFGGESDNRPFSISQASDGGNVAAGYTKDLGAGGYDTWIVKLGPSGEISWRNNSGVIPDFTTNPYWSVSLDPSYLNYATVVSTTSANSTDTAGTVRETQAIPHTTSATVITQASDVSELTNGGSGLTNEMFVLMGVGSALTFIVLVIIIEAVRTSRKKAK